MKKGIFQEFDGYDQVVKDIESSRRWGVGYSADTHGADQYIDLLHPSRVRVRVSDIIEETPSAKTLRLVSEDGYLPPFQAGQYIALFFDFDGLRTSRPYSISSAPNQVGYYDITVRRVADGLVSNYLLNDVKPGSTFECSGPSGNFHYNPLFHSRNMVCIAGGSGITPFMSMVREIAERGLDRNVVLFYGNKDLSDVIFHDELAGLSQRFENIRYIPTIENPPAAFEGAAGFITGALIGETLGSLSDKTFYMCGPQGLYDFCMPELENLGISRHKVRREVYGAPKDISTDPAWPEGVEPDRSVQIRVKGKIELEAKSGEPLLAALERGGVVVPSLCRSGECSMCRVRVNAGKVFQPAGTPIRKSDRKFGYVHSCVSYPLTDLDILV